MRNALTGASRQRDAYEAGWRAARTMEHERVMFVVGRLDELAPGLTGEGHDAIDELRNMLLRIVAR